MKQYNYNRNLAGDFSSTHRLLLFIFILCTSVAAYPQGENWRTISELPTPRHDIGSCVVDGKIYCIGGTSRYAGSQTTFNMVTVFDPVTGIWDTLAPMTKERFGLFACEVDGKIYAFGGRKYNNTENLSIVEIYDIEKDEWTTGTSMPTGTILAAGCVLEDKVYLIGGLQLSGWMATNRVLRYDPVEDSWESLPPLKVARGLLSANVLNGKIYITGGANNPDIAYDIVEEYDPAMNVWVNKTAMPSRRGFHAGIVINDRIWVMNGTEDFRTIKTTAEIYNPDTDTWSKAVKADFPLIGSWNPTLVTTHKKVYLFGGFVPISNRSIPEIIELDYPVIRLMSDTLLMTEDSLRCRYFEEGTVYILSKSTSAELDSITKYMIGSWQGVKDQELKIPLNTYPPGTYYGYGIASDGRIDRAISPFHVTATTYVEIPDTIFRNALIDEGVDINGDGLISHVEAETIIKLNVKGEWDERNMLDGITDLTGIEAFVNLDTLFCGSNPLTGLDLSKNLNLRYLDCSISGLAELEVSSNSRLSVLSCFGNALPMLDLSNNPNLVKLYCSSNQLTSLDLTNNPNLEELYCGSNLLTSLSLRHNLSLKKLSCGQCYGLNLCHPPAWDGRTPPPGNNLEVLDISNNILLSELKIVNMDTPAEICYREGINLDNIDIDTSGSPNVCFETDCDGFCNSIVSLTEFMQDELSIYPNPATDQLTIETGNIREFSVEIASINGQKLMSRSLSGYKNQIELSSLQKGVFFITVRSKDFVTTKKVLKL